MPADKLLDHVIGVAIDIFSLQFMRGADGCEQVGVVRGDDRARRPASACG